MVGGNSGGSSGTLNVNGGTVSVPASDSFNVGNGILGTNVSATVNLNAGLLQTPGWTIGTSAGFTSTLNFNGGTLKALAGLGSISRSWHATTNVQLYAGGGTINTNGLAITIGNPIGNPANSAISSITPRRPPTSSRRRRPSPSAVEPAAGRAVMRC